MNNQTVDELNNRKLNECYFSIMFILTLLFDNAYKREI